MPQRKIGRITLTGMMMCFFNLCAIPADAQIGGRDAQKEMLSRVVIPNRNVTRKLKALGQFIADGNFGGAADALHQICTDPASEGVFWNDKDKLVNSQREARHLFDAAGPKAADAFEVRFGSEARTALKEAEQAQQFGRMADIGRRYFFTAAGFAALDAQATYLLDQGQAADASALWMQLARASAHRSRVTPRFIIKLAAALKKSRKDSEAVAFLTSAQRDFPWDDAQWQAIHKALQGALPNASSSSSDWLVGLGDPAHNRIATGSVPYLWPHWSRGLETKSNRLVESHWSALMRQAQGDLADTESEPANFAGLPIAIGDQIVARDFRGIAATSLKTGQPMWRYQAPVNAYDLWEDIREYAVVGAAFDVATLSNAAHGLIASNGQYVFALNFLGVQQRDDLVSANGDDDLFSPPRRFYGQSLPNSSSSQWANQLVCLKLPEPGELNGGSEQLIAAAWTIGAESGRADDPLKKHVFLGPPLPLGDSVYVMTEHRGEVHLVRLQAATGQVIRTTRLCSARAAFSNGDDGTLRPLNVCIPVAAEGIILCPTESGALVAVDELFGEISWMYGMHSEYSGRPQPRLWVDAPHVSQDLVFYLSPSQDQLFCLDLKTGTRRWIAPIDGEYVGTITNNAVIVIDREQVVAIGRTTGKELWRTKVGFVAGRGVALNSKYVIPLRSGGAAKLDLSTGKLSGFEHSVIASAEHSDDLFQRQRQRATELQEFGFPTRVLRSELRLGNLIAHRDAVISLSARHLTTFHQAQALQEKLAQAPTARDQLMSADIDLTLGEISAAEARLTRLQESGPKDMSEALIRSTQRACVLTRLAEAKPDTDLGTIYQWIDQLHDLSQSPAERAQAMAWRLHYGMKGKAWLSLGVAARELSKSPDEFIVPRDADHYVVRSSSLARRGMQLAFQAKDGIERDRLLKFMQADLVSAQRDGSINALMRFVELYPAALESGALRNQLAARLLSQNRWHEAEVLLLANSKHEDLAQRAVSALLLIRLLCLAELEGEASRLLEQLQRDLGDVEINVDDREIERVLADVFDLRALRANEIATVTDWLEHVKSGTRLAEVRRQRQPLTWDVPVVQIKNRGAITARPELNETYHQSQRTISLGPSSDLDLLTRIDDNGLVWSLTERLSGVERNRIELPTQIDIDHRTHHLTGHVLSVGTIGQLNGVSLLDRQLSNPLWTLNYPLAKDRGDLIEIGPSTGQTSFLFSRRHLFAVETATGRVRWRRSDLTLPVGLDGSERQYIVADDLAVVVFQPDGVHYTALLTSTGEIIRRGSLPIEVESSIPIGLGRKVAFVARPVRGVRHFRIWDPVTDRDDVNETIQPNEMPPQPARDGRVIRFQPSGRLRVFSSQQIEPELDLTLTLTRRELQAVPNFFVDGDQAFLNLSFNDAPAADNVIISDMALAHEPLLTGSLFAIDRAESRVLWKKTGLRNSCYLRIDAGRLPFLVTASIPQRHRLEPPPEEGEPGPRSFEIEAIDRRTGRTIGRLPNGIVCRLAHAEFNRDQGRLSLYGLTQHHSNDSNRWQTLYGTVNRIDLDFPPPKQGIARVKVTTP